MLQTKKAFLCSQKASRWTFWLQLYTLSVVVVTAVVSNLFYDEVQNSGEHCCYVFLKNAPYLKPLSEILHEIFIPKCIQRISFAFFFFYQIIYLPHFSRVNIKTSGLKERKIYHSSPQQSCTAAVNRKTLMSSNGWVEKSRAVSTKESLIFFTQCGLRMPPVDLVRVVLIAPCSMRQKANWKALKVLLSIGRSNAAYQEHNLPSHWAWNNEKRRGKIH